MTLSLRFRALRLALKASWPWVGRQTHRKLQTHVIQLIDNLVWQARPAHAATLQVQQPLATTLRGELCLFVSHATTPVLKAHVQHHLTQLLDAGIAVVLVLNTARPDAPVQIAPELLARLSGVLRRENTGFDFAAWAHAFTLLPASAHEAITRLYLVNDSIVSLPRNGPFLRMLEAIRAHPHDVIGLTGSASPVDHLQSYFLVFNTRALRSDFMATFWPRVLSLPTKEQVIDVYEARLSAMARAHGLSTAALYPPLSNDRHTANDTHLRWRELLALGFPYIKTSVIKKAKHRPAVEALLPAEHIESAC